MKTNIRRPSLWRSIHVISLDGSPIMKYQLDELGNHTKKFKKMIPRKKKDIYPHSGNNKSLLDDLTSPDLEGDDSFNYCNFLDNSKSDITIINKKTILNSTKTLECKEETKINNDKNVTKPEENSLQISFNDLTNHSESEDLFLMEIYDKFF